MDHVGIILENVKDMSKPPTSVYIYIYIYIGE